MLLNVMLSFLLLCFSVVPFQRCWCIERLGGQFFWKFPASSLQFDPKIDWFCHCRCRTTSILKQVQEKTNDREEIFERVLQHFLNLSSHTFLSSKKISLNIDEKMVLPVKFAGSHCNFAHRFLNLLEDTRCCVSWEDLLLDLHGLSIKPIQFVEVVVF